MGTGITIAEKKESLRSLLVQNKTALSEALPPNLTPDRMIRYVLTSVHKNPKLLNCSMQSIAMAVLNACECGLPVDGYHGHLVPFKNQCQFIPDYKGLVALAYSCGIVVRASVVYEADIFEETRGLNPSIRHVPFDSLPPEQQTERRRDTNDGLGELFAAYAIAIMAGESVPPVFKVMYRREIEKHRRMSRSSGRPDSPWNQWTESMWMKTAIKALLKMVPRNKELVRAVELDNEAEMGATQSPPSIDLVQITAESDSVPDDGAEVDDEAVAGSVVGSQE